MKRGRNQRQSRDDQSRFTDRDFDRDRNWNRSNDYRENPAREYHWSNEDRGYYSDRNQEYRSQYFSGREDYPGPGRSQGFGTGRRHDPDSHRDDWGNSNFSQNTSSQERQRMSDRPFGQRPGQPSYSERITHAGDVREYGYGSGTTDMPASRAGDRREDESYNWGDHAGDSRSGLFRGKGPKGYKRSDERIREEINERLCDDDQLDASEIVVSVSEGEVNLSGTVSDRSSKRRAEDIIEEISGVKNVENRIRVGQVTPEEPAKEGGKRDTANGRTKVLQES